MDCARRAPADTTTLDSEAITHCWPSPPAPARCRWQGCARDGPIRLRRTRGAAHFLRETVSRVRCAGATGPLTVRVDSGFYTHPILVACRTTEVRFSITVRLQPSLRNVIEAIPVAD